ncbi:MFS transporter [Microbacterium sp.]|uniref:MFS transporter n=2 Tax=Microbacterium sp. TaxID=51671 RepID=UPI0028119320|nr:MFS transporter [Microbacterium sp.]
MPSSFPSGASSTPALSRPSGSLFIRLCAMMLLEFIVFGSWFATLGLVLATNGLDMIIGTAYSFAALGAIFSPMLLGAIADRYISSQKVLAGVHMVGGILLLLLPGLVAAQAGGAVLGLILVYMLFFMPTLGLTNTIAFRHLGGNDKLFPYVRVFGTIGWIVAGLGVGWAGLSASTGVFVVAAVASFALGIYAFTLPKTPPTGGGRFSFGDLVGAKSWVLFRQRNFVIFGICALLTTICLATYNAYAAPFLGALGIENVAGVLAIGQISEVIFIVTIPFVLVRLGMKWALLGGMVMWGVRFVLFMLAAGDMPWLAIVGIALHGICNDFFLILGAMYVDQVAPVALKAQAQSYFLFVSTGLGAFLGSLVAGQVYNAVVAPSVASGESDLGAWSALWLLPIGASAVTAVLWIVFFRMSEHRATEAAVLADVAAQRDIAAERTS